MKKILAICLMLMLLATAAAAETTWGEGLGPEKPYIGSPAVNLEENIGYMMMMPMNATAANPGITMLQIFMPREDVQPGEGTISLYSKTEGLIAEIEAKELTIRPMTEEEKEALIWGSGVVVEIPIEPLKVNDQYYVKMTEGCIVDMKKTVLSSVIEESDIWTFSTETPNYVESLTFVRTAEEKEETVEAEAVQAGDKAKVSVLLGEEGAAAAVFCEAGMIQPDVTYIAESGELIVSFPEAGETKWGVVFLNAEGKTAYTVSYTTVVAGKAE